MRVTDLKLVYNNLRSFDQRRAGRAFANKYWPLRPHLDSLDVLGRGAMLDERRTEEGEFESGPRPESPITKSHDAYRVTSWLCLQLLLQLSMPPVTREDAPDPNPRPGKGKSELTLSLHGPIAHDIEICALRHNAASSPSISTHNGSV